MIGCESGLIAVTAKGWECLKCGAFAERIVDIVHVEAEEAQEPGIGLYAPAKNLPEGCCG